MNRVRKALLLSALGLLGTSAVADESVWKPASSVSPRPAAPAPVPIPVAPPVIKPAAPAWAPPPMPRPEAPPPAETTVWLPARRVPLDERPVPEAIIPAIQEVASPVALPAPTVLSSVEPAPPPTPLTEVPARLPAVLTVDPPVPTLPEVKAPPMPPSAGEKLPAPRTEAIDKPTSTYCFDPICNGPATPTAALEPAPGSTPPIRNRTFGTPPINLSRDMHIRDIFGTDMLTPEREHGRLIGGADALFEGGDTYFVQAEYMLGWVNKPRIPALASTSISGTGTGVLGNPDTRLLLGPGEFGPDVRSGFRIRAGGWLDECARIGVDGSFFFLGKAGDRVEYNSDQFPVIARPFFAPNAAIIDTGNGGQVVLPGEFVELVARPGTSTGRLIIDTDSFLWGADANVRREICRDCTGGHGWFAGYRHLNLSERLTITEFITATSQQGDDPVGTRVVVQDEFRTANQFHGGQIGGYWNRRWDRWDLEVRGSLALGVTHSTIDIAGSQVRTRPGQAAETFRGGLLATGSNLGRFTTNNFSVVPEATVNLGWMATSNVRLYVGYNFLYWSNVLRPGDQIDRIIDVTLVPNPPADVPASGQNRPQPTFRTADLFSNGIQFGAEVRW